MNIKTLMAAAVAASLTLQAAPKTNVYELVDASWFGPKVNKESFQNDYLQNIIADKWVYAYPHEWYIMFTDAGSLAYSGNTVVFGDMYSSTSGSSGTFRKYRVAAYPEDHIGEYGYERDDVTFSIADKDNSVGSFTNNIITANGLTNGTVIVSATDSDGLTKQAVLTMTKVDAGNVVKTYAYESPLTGRYLLASNALVRLSGVSTASVDMVCYDLCRGPSHTYEKWKANLTEEDYWYCPRQLSRFGTGGRIIQSEWTWKTSGQRVKPSVLNKDFFWPELQDSMRCFSIDVHEVNNDNGWMPYQRIAVSPHYRIEVAHYGYSNNHYIYYMTSDHDASTMVTKGGNTQADLGKVLIDGTENSYADIRLIRHSFEIDQDKCAKFAPKETLEALSKTLFTYASGWTLTSHQTVNPICVSSLGGIVSGWAGIPGKSSRVESYRQPLSNSDPLYGYDNTLTPLEHKTHMFNSGDVVFLATPDAKIIPLFMFTTVGGGSSIVNVLGNLNRMIEEDSLKTYGVKESLQFWTVQDLYWGGTNSIETASL